MKKLWIVLGVVAGLLVLTALILPWVVNVDQYRPQITEMANQKINGKLELGKLHLSLWGQIRIQVEGVRLLDPRGREVLQVKDAYFHVPFLPILTGSPVITFKMKDPSLLVVKNRAGKLNLASLMKSEKVPAEKGEPKKDEAQKAPPSVSKTAPKAETDRGKKIPGLLARARLGVELKNAVLTYRDEATGLGSQIKDLNILLKDISLSHPTELELWANVDTQMGKTLSVQGEARLNGKAQPYLKDSEVDRVDLSAKLDLSDLRISVPGAFEKKAGIPITADLMLSATEQNLKIEKLVARFFNAEISAQGTVTHLDQESGPEAKTVHFSMKSNEIDFKPWAELIPSLKDYDLGGTAKLEAQAKGPAKKMGYEGRLSFTGLTAKSPQLKAQPKIDGMIHLLPDQLDQIWMTMKAPGNDLKITGKLISFTKPQLKLDIVSTGMDLDQLYAFPPKKAKSSEPPAEAPASKGSGTSGGKAGGGSQRAVDYDAQLASVRENKTLSEAGVDIGIDIKMLEAQQIRLNNLACKINFRNLVAGIEACGFKIFSGKIQADSHFMLKPKTPVYDFNAHVSGLNLTEAVQSQLELFKNTVKGVAFFEMHGQGASFNPDAATSNLKAQGKMKIDQASFVTIDVVKMVSEALNRAIEQAASKVPSIRGKKVGNLPSHGTQFESITSDFSIAGGKFMAPNFFAKAVPQQGIDLRGDTTVGIQDLSLKASWDVSDTYNLTRARDIAVEQEGIRVEHVLADGSSPVHFPVNVGCTLKAPCYSYTEVPEFLGKIAWVNIRNAVTQKATERAKEELRKKAESVVPKSAPPAVKDALKKFLH